MMTEHTQATECQCTDDIDKKFEPYIQMAKAFDKMDYQGIYLVDLKGHRVIYASDDPLLLCGLSNRAFDGIGFAVYTDVIQHDEGDMLKEMIGTLHTFYDEIPCSMLGKFVLYLNFHIIHEGHRVLVSHKLTMLTVGDEHEPSLMVGLVSPSVHDRVTIYAGVIGTEFFYEYNPDDKAWSAVKPFRLSVEELRMLHLTAQGFSLEQISNIMFKSLDTIKLYRRQIFRKMGVKNISEAISHAVNYCLI